MFNFLVRLWLAGILSIALGFALQHIYVTLRDGRKYRRHQRAHFYAQLVVMDRVNKGEFEGRSTEDLRTAYEFEKIAYLND